MSVECLRSVLSLAMYLVNLLKVQENKSTATGEDPGGDWGDRPPKTYETNSIHHDLVKFGKQHSRYEAILSSVVLSQQC